jgi:quercetin dioxygenase-like cupin family protein
MKRVILNPIFRDTVTFIKTASETNGQFTEAELILIPGGGNPLHYHLSYSETFTPIEGLLGLGLAKRKKKFLRPGETYTID